MPTMTAEEQSTEDMYRLGHQVTLLMQHHAHRVVRSHGMACALTGPVLAD